MEWWMNSLNMLCAVLKCLNSRYKDTEPIEWQRSWERAKEKVLSRSHEVERKEGTGIGSRSSGKERLNSKSNGYSGIASEPPGLLGDQKGSLHSLQDLAVLLLRVFWSSFCPCSAPTMSPLYLDRSKVFYSCNLTEPKLHN